jgi:hypothetical protein
MGKGKQKQGTGRVVNQTTHLHIHTPRPPTFTHLKTTTAIASDPTLGYKLCVLLYDLVNFVKDPNAERRLNATTDEHYISLPYFSPDEATVVKSAIVDAELSSHSLGAVVTGYTTEYSEEQGGEIDGTLAACIIDRMEDKTFDGVVRALLGDFVEKRRASGDARPCGPHHLAPMYASIFGISLDKTKDEKFLERLRRTGIDG